MLNSHHFKAINFFKRYWLMHQIKLFQKCQLPGHTYLEGFKYSISFHHIVSINWISTFFITINPISEGIQNHEVLKAGAIQWPPHISGVSGPILMILDSKQGFLRSRNWLVRVSRALHVSYTCQARVIVSLPKSPRNHLCICVCVWTCKHVKCP